MSAMQGALAKRIKHAQQSGAAESTTESKPVRWILTSIALLFLALFLLLPLVVVVSEALKKGAGAYFASFHDPDARSAIQLTLIAAGISVPLNIVFGVA